MASVKLTSIKKWHGSYGSAESVSTLAQKAYEMTITLEWAAIACMCGVILLVLVGGAAAAIARERNRQKENKDHKDKELIDTVHAVRMAMEIISDRVAGKSESDRDKHTQVLEEVKNIAKLVLDVEDRLTEQVKETRQLLMNPRRDGHGRTGTRIDINGNVNQAGGQIKND